MINRDYKMLVPGQIYHVFNRGNNKEKIFLDTTDFENFVARLKIILGVVVPDPKSTLVPVPAEAFSVLGYCLMDNHYHFLIKQNGTVPISKLITKLCTSYAKYFNKKYERVGHIFQDKFKAKMVTTDAYLLRVSAYIHNNPGNPLVWKYSSLRTYCGLENDKISNTDLILGCFNGNAAEYVKFVTLVGKDDL